jgi:hypothetical protein
MFAFLLNSPPLPASETCVLWLATAAHTPKVLIVKNAGILLSFLLLASLGRLSAQVTVELFTDQDQFLPGEKIPVTVRITNRSGQTLAFGPEKGWLKFAIQAKEGYVAMRQNEIPTDNDFTLQSSEHANVKLNIAPFFQLDKPGDYKITATITIPEWKRQVTSDPKAIDVINGARVWQQEFGVPKAAGETNGLPALRIYALQEANYLRGRKILYAQVTDSGARFNRVVPIGPMISFGQPEAKVGKTSNLHILYQNGPRTFNYSVVNPQCEIITRQTYEYTPGRPRMVADADGDISVQGGTRLISRDDLPAQKSSAVNDVPPPPNP